MRGLYKYKEYYGVMGELYGLFFADSDEIEQAKNKEIYMGEMLGKHSEIFATLDDTTLTLVTDDPDEVRKLEELGITGGCNPLLYFEGEEGY